MRIHVPNHTQIPNSLLDEGAKELSSTEFKVIAVILRKTLGFHRESVTITLGSLADHMAMDKGTVSRACVRLVELGLLEVEKNSAPDGSPAASTYYPVFVYENSGGVVAPAQHVVAELQRPSGNLQGGVPAESIRYKEERNNTERKEHTSIAELLQIHNRTKGSKKASSKERAEFQEWLLQRSETGDEIEGAFGLFCEDPYWVERKLPLRAFRDQFQKYLHRQQEGPGPVDGQDLDHGSPALEPAAPETVSPKLDYQAEWNHLVPLAVTDYPAGPEDGKLRRVMVEDPEFQRAFEKICKISQGIRENKPDATWLDFYWLARTKTGGGMVNWRRLLTTMRGMAIPEKSRTVPETEGQRSSREAHERNEKRRAEAGPMEPITSIEQLMARAAKKVVVSE